MSVTKSDGSVAYTIEDRGGRLTRNTAHLRTLDELNKIEFNFWFNNQVTLGGTVYNGPGTNEGTMAAHWDAATDTFKITAVYRDDNKILLPSAATVTAAQLRNFTANQWTDPGIQVHTVYYNI